MYFIKTIQTHFDSLKIVFNYYKDIKCALQSCHFRMSTLKDAYDYLYLTYNVPSSMSEVKISSSIITSTLVCLCKIEAGNASDTSPSNKAFIACSLFYQMLTI